MPLVACRSAGQCRRRGGSGIARVFSVASPLIGADHIKGAVALWGNPVLWSTRRVRGTPRMASWRSGYAEDCKSLHPGSIPGEASIQILKALSMVDFAQARRMMVDSQLRTFDVNDIALLDAVDSVPRELFVLPGREELAYIDQDILVGDGAERRFMLSPMVLGRMIQALELEAGEKVLDVACGRGYASAVFNELGTRVVALESDAELAEAARRSLAAAGATQVAVEVGALDQGSPKHAPFNAILVNGSVELRPDALLQQLAEGGRLVCVKGRGRAARATLYVRTGDAFGERSLFEAAAPLLAPFVPAPGFTF
jgi:protein-L-isoaspartate(D-aspartate) O-methyltransferase